MARYYPYEEWIEAHCQARLKERLVAMAQADNCPLGEVVIRLICTALKEKPEYGLIPRKTPGRKPNLVAKKRRARKSE